MQPGVFDAVAFARELQTFRYLVGPPQSDCAAREPRAETAPRLCAALAMNTMLFTLPRYLGMSSDSNSRRLFHRLTLILGTLSFGHWRQLFLCPHLAQPARARPAHRTFRSRSDSSPRMPAPCSRGARRARFVFDFVSTFTFLMLAGRWLQQKAVERNRHQLLAAQAEPPPVRLASGEKVSVVRIATGDVFSVEPGQVVPVLARLYSEGATLGMEWISGESEAASARRGRLVPAGAMNCGQSAIELEAREPWADSLLAKLLRITPVGATRDAAFERFLRGYIGVVARPRGGGFLRLVGATGALLPALQVLTRSSSSRVRALPVSLCRCAGDLGHVADRRLGVFIRDGEACWASSTASAQSSSTRPHAHPRTISLLNPEALRRLRAD